MRMVSRVLRDEWRTVDTLPSTLARQFVMDAEIENQQGRKPEKEPKGFHRVRLSQPATGQGITISE